MKVSKYDIDLDLTTPSDSSHWYLAELIGANKRVLDVGCSTGYFASALSKLGNTCWGVEYDGASAEVARRHLEDVAVADLDNTELAELFPGQKFDSVVFADVLEHLRDPIPVLRSARRLLAPGGSVLISLPNISHGDIRLALMKGHFDYTTTGILDNTHTKFFTRDGLERFVNQCGFIIANIRRTKADLFTTEQKLSRSDYDEHLIELVLADPESQTYQFVVEVVPDDSTTLDRRLASRVEELDRAINVLATERDALGAASHELRQNNETLNTELESTRARHGSDIASLRARMEAAEAQVVEYQERVVEYQERVVEYQERVDSLQELVDNPPVDGISLQKLLKLRIRARLGMLP